MSQNSLRRAGIILALLTVSLLVSCEGLSLMFFRQPATAGLTDINNIEYLRARFNQDGGMPRLILLMSPT